MSSVAFFYKLPASAAEELRIDRFQCIKDRGQEVVDYQWPGYVMFLLLVYLKEDAGIDLTHSSYDALVADLSQGSMTSFYIFTPAHRDAYLAKLSPAFFSEAELRDFFNEFNESEDEDEDEEEGEEDEVGQAMLDGIAAIRDSLASLDADSIVLCTIG